MPDLDELALESIHDDEASRATDDLVEQLEDEARRLGLDPRELLDRMKVELAARAEG